MLKRPPRLEQLFERGFELRTTEGYHYEKLDRGDDWHQEPSPCPDGNLRFHWHASALAGCPRAQVLKRAKMPSDGRPLDSEITFAFGHTVHSLLEEFSSATVDEVPVPNIVFDGRISHIGAENGGCFHPDAPHLKARADWVFSVDGAVTIMDLKTEGTHLFRVDEAKAKQAKDFVKQEHKIQIACNAIIQEGMGLVPDKVQYGAVVYCSKTAGKDRDGRAYSKNKWKWDTQWFEVTEELRAEVYTRLDMLNKAWEQFENDGGLPARLPVQMYFGKESAHFLCKPRSADDDRGAYCEFRRACYSLPVTAQVDHEEA